MIAIETLERVTASRLNLQNARRELENVLDIELKESEWQPGSGAKPHRVRELQKHINTLKIMTDELDVLWS
jgi:hypothetical protein